MYSSNTITTSASMTKKKKPIHKKNNKRKTVKLSTESDSSQNRPLTWVEKISWQLVETALPPPPATTSFVPSFTVVSWNVLAEAYTTRRSHPHLPLSYQSVVFDRRKRRALLQQTLHRLATMADGGVDIFCLQEVDLPEQVTHYLQHSLGYQACQTPTNKAGGGIAGRVDACAICFSTRQFEFLDYDRFPPQVVHLDDIASLGRTKPTATRRSASSSLACSGLSSSFLRHNMALMVALRHKSTQQPVVLVNAHLYWHPGFEYVKLCQMHHVLQQATTFAADISSKSSLPPTNGDDRAKPAIIVCGDLNSLPKSSVHQYLTQGTVNAKRIAPWRFFWNPLPYDDEEGDDDEEDPADDAKHLRCQEEEDNDEGEDEVEDDEVSDLDEQESFDPNKKSETAEISNIPSDKEENGHKLSSKRDDDVVSSINLKIDNLDLNKTLITTTTTPPDAITSETSYSTENVRYLVDYTLNRLCRWLRILGIDAAIETESEEQLRTKEGKL
jgi:mRNA deadenylase 3'-5' endonuclease subunit Ccr4